MEHQLTMHEFYEKYYRVPEYKASAVRVLGKEYFDMFMKAESEGKQLIQIKRRGIDWDGYMVGLIRTGTELVNGKNILLLGNPQKSIEDLKMYFGLEVNFDSKTKIITLNK